MTEVEGEEIRASSVLPADRRAIELVTADGLRLVGEVALPAGREPQATLVCVHPLPTHGGMMDRVDGLVAAAACLAVFQWASAGAVLAWR